MIKYLIVIFVGILSVSLYAQETTSSWDKYPKIDAGQNWYETYIIAENTYAISAPNHWQGTISYLLLGSDKALLVDTGMGIGNIKKTVDAITTLPVIVINSHSHYDHVSNNHHFETIYGRDLAFTEKNSSGHPKATWDNAIQPSAIKKNLPDSFSFENYQSKPFEINKYVEDGEIIDLGGREVEIIFTPGHTPDSMLFFDRELGLLMTGDTFFPSTLWAHRADADFKNYLDSAQRMAAMQGQVKYILPGHGRTMVSPTFLTKLRDAFLSMRDPNTPYTKGEDRRRYEFDGFAALVKDPPE
ncbi:MAG: MBL fold metallo-hydrolase [Kordiimonadaceae bacterium]|nr:MBL fold metallo-hydrolase [Kordiimonadaceae bacterium]